MKGALDRLSLEGTEIDPLLDDLELREFVSAERRSTISGEQAFKFKHVLIREGAYGGLSKAARAGYPPSLRRVARRRAARSFGGACVPPRSGHRVDGRARRRLHPRHCGRAAAALEEAGRRALARETNATARKPPDSRRGARADPSTSFPGARAACA